MGTAGFPLKQSARILLFLVAGGLCAIYQETWCYDKPSCGPKTWRSLGSCNGQAQSPINIDNQEIRLSANLGPVKFTGYENRKKPKLLKNNGHHRTLLPAVGNFRVGGLQLSEFSAMTLPAVEFRELKPRYLVVEVDVHPGATISSDGLPATYTLNQFHLHWGTNDRKGSEHTIDGQRQAMELHLVHTKNNMSFAEALEVPDGLVVLAFFIKKSHRNTQVTPWNTLAKLLDEIPVKGDSKVLNGEFSVGGLLSMADVSQYYFYKGSLTTPNCNEVVTWLIFPEPLEISGQVVKKLTNSLYFTTAEEDRPMQNNFRPVQLLNDREIYYHKQNRSIMECVQRCFTHGP